MAAETRSSDLTDAEFDTNVDLGRAKKPAVQEDSIAAMKEMMLKLMDKVNTMEQNQARMFNASSNATVSCEGHGLETGQALASRAGSNTSQASGASTSRCEVESVAGRGNIDETASDLESGFQVDLSPETDDHDCDVLSLLEADLETQEEYGRPVHDKLARIANNRFTVKLPDGKLKEKMSVVLTPDNCLGIRPPRLNEEIVERLDKTSKKNDCRLMHVQKLISCATSALINATDELHSASAQWSVSKEGRKFAEVANKMLSASGDVMAMLGMASQELSARRRHQMMAALPKDLASICNNDNVPVTDKLFGNDIEKAMKSARDSFKMKSSNLHHNRFHPFKRSQSGKGHFLGQPSTSFQRGQQFRGRGMKQGGQWQQRSGFSKGSKGKY